jgi:thiamine-phosphate pyrophosphorylase
MSIGRLCVITDTLVQTRFSHEELAALALEGGADMIQLREKGISDRDLTEVARRMKSVCELGGAQLIINDRLEVARDSGAHGIHLGRGDASLAAARAALGTRGVIGATAHTLEEALAAEAAGADYLGFGHIFPTASKHKTTPPVGLEALARVCAAVRIPVLAIGGITADNARACIDAGAHGVAVIAAVCTAPDPRAATARIRSTIG